MYNHLYLKKVAVLFVMVSNILFRFLECWKIHNTVPKDTKLWTPPMFFLIICSYLNILFHCTHWSSLWRRQKSIRNICLLVLENIPLKTRYSCHKVLNLIFNNIAYILWTLIFGVAGLIIFSGNVIFILKKIISVLLKYLIVKLY